MYNTGARLYESETLLAHFDFLPRCFQTSWRSTWTTIPSSSPTSPKPSPDSVRLHFYGVALRYAPTPQAKGKIER